MKILVHLGHPAHYHLFKNVINDLTKSNEITVVIKQKDILEDLLKTDKIEYTVILRNERSKSKLINIFRQVKQTYNLLMICIRLNPNIMMGTSVTITHIGKMLNISSIYFGEDDTSVVPILSKICLPFATEIVSPIVCDRGKWSYKKIAYNGFQKLAYLHPNHFSPDKTIVEKYFDLNTPYYILRFAELKAHHDCGVGGINTEIAQKLIDILSKKGRVYITSERVLELQFEKYRLKINPLDIHHIMYFADMYIGDSQSMAVEAAMLGTPSIRFNDFAGKIGVLEELEQKYELTYGIKTSEPNKLFEKIHELLNTPNLKDVFLKRREKMLADKIDVTAFFTWFIENYPESKKIMTEDPDYQYRFK